MPINVKFGMDDLRQVCYSMPRATLISQRVAYRTVLGTPHNVNFMNFGNIFT